VKPGPEPGSSSTGRPPRTETPTPSTLSTLQTRSWTTRTVIVRGYRPHASSRADRQGQGAVGVPRRGRGRVHSRHERCCLTPHFPRTLVMIRTGKRDQNPRTSAVTLDRDGAWLTCSRVSGSCVSGFGARAVPGKQGLRFGPRDDLLCERTDQAGDMADRLIGDVGRAEGRDEMTCCQIEVFPAYPAPPMCLPHGRTGIRVGAAKRRGEELDLSSLELGHVRSREKPGEFGVAGDTHIEIVNHGDQGRFSADGIVDARSCRVLIVGSSNM
jgi:hypothetical protein